MKVLIVGHACGPGAGSEPGVTWNLAWRLSGWHQVWVIAHPERKESVERFLARNPNQNLHFVWVKPRVFDPWDPKQGQKWVRLHYWLWQREAFRVARSLHRQVGFDVTHHVSLMTVSAPPKLWKLPVPFVWGPIGGGQTAPPAFRAYFGKAWPAEAVRALRVRVLPFHPGLRRTVRSAAITLAANRETLRLLESAGAVRARLFMDSGIPADSVSPTPPVRVPNDELVLLWAGRLEPIKGLPLALHALAAVTGIRVQLLVAGAGPLRGEWERLTAVLGLRRRVHFLGQVPYAAMRELFQRADAFVFTSLRDSFGSVVLEAMASGLPILALDHQGAGTFVPAEAAIKVPVTEPDATIAALAEGIRRLAESPEERRRMGRAAWACALDQTWDRRAEQFHQLYTQLTGGVAEPALAGGVR